MRDLAAMLASILAGGLLMSAVAAADDGETRVREFTCGKLFYRTLYLHRKSASASVSVAVDAAQDDEETLYVGGMDAIFRLDPANVSNSDCQRDGLPLPAANPASCVSKGKSADYDCRNHVRVIQGIGQGDRLYVCGTNAHSPRDEVVYANLTRLARHEFYPGVGDVAIGKCPFDPEDNSTALWVEDGNPGGHPAIYSGTVAEFTKADTVIFRGDIFDENTGRREYSYRRTIKYDSHMLDKPDFVGSYDVGEYVYLFFRETAVEHLGCGRTVFSRVARVCKRDVGGKNVLTQNWATFLKARLVCSIDGEFPFYFDEIQHVFKADDDDSLFHGVFTTGRSGLTGSAICTFRLADVAKAFDEGRFKEQETSTSVWLPVAAARVPEPRPGSCVDDTRQLSDSVLNFIRKHPLMDDNVNRDGDAPVLYRADVIFTRLVVDRLTAGPYGREKTFHVYYAGTEDGRVFKVARWRDADGRSQSRLLDVFEATAPFPVRAMALSKRHRSLYVSSDESVVQIGVQMCAERYPSCARCVRDPHCGWDGEAGACRSRHFSLLQDPAGEARGVCEGATPTEQVTADFGQAVRLPCQPGPNPDPTKGRRPAVAWYHFDARGNKRKLELADRGDDAGDRSSSSDAHFLSSEGSLVILGASERDAGHYKCQAEESAGETLAAYELRVDAHRCGAPGRTTDYQRVYSQWCSQFQKYRAALDSWEQRQNKCAALTGQQRLLASGVASNSVYSPLV